MPSERSSGIIFGRVESLSIIFASSRASSPSIRGTLNPQMSASRTPTVNPLLAREAAILTVTEDLPTPPLPEAIDRTLVVGCISVGDALSRAYFRARSITRAFSLAFNSSQ